jgi:hypothetical protein
VENTNPIDEGSITQQKVEKTGWILTGRSLKHVEDLCAKNGLDVATYYRWIKEGASSWVLPFANMICSEKIDEKFLSWIAGEKIAVTNMVNIQLNKIQQILEDAAIPLDVILSRPIIGVTPLVQFVFGNYLGYPQAVEKLRPEAKDDLLCKPWMAVPLKGMKQFFP